MLLPKPQDLGCLYTSVCHSPLRVAEDQWMGYFENTASLLEGRLSGKGLRAVCGSHGALWHPQTQRIWANPWILRLHILLLYPEQGTPLPLASISIAEKMITAAKGVFLPPSISLKHSSSIYPLHYCYKLIKQAPHSLTLKVSQPLISYYPSCYSTCWLLQINGLQCKHMPDSWILIKYMKVWWFVSTMPYSSLRQLRFKCWFK